MSIYFLKWNLSIFDLDEQGIIIAAFVVGRLSLIVVMAALFGGFFKKRANHKGFPKNWKHEKYRLLWAFIGFWAVQKPIKAGLNEEFNRFKQMRFILLAWAKSGNVYSSP